MGFSRVRCSWLGRGVAGRGEDGWGLEGVLGSLGLSPCSGPRRASDGARAGARRAPGVVVQPRLAPGATRARGVNGSPLQLHLHLAAAGALRHGCAAHQRWVPRGLRAGTAGLAVGLPEQRRGSRLCRGSLALAWSVEGPSHLGAFSLW